MADPASYRPAPGTIPDQPGVYRFYDKNGRVIYVGKAKSLRSRLSSYFQDITALHTRTRQMVMNGARVDWTVVDTEVEALQLEYSWIKEFDPRFNVRYRDDKSYPSLAVTLNEEYPRLQVMRGPKKKGVRYFGPYAHAWAIRETLDLLTRVFPARTCSNGVFKRHAQMGRPCLLGYIDKCSAPCIGRVTAHEHREIVDDFCDFMAGKTDQVERRLRRQMLAASENLEFERAGRLRDDLEALTKATEKNAIVLPDGTDCDVVAFAQDDLEASVQVFYVRGGRVRGRRGWVVDKVEDVTTSQLVEQYLLQVYESDDDTTPAIPRTILVPELPPEPEAVANRLSQLRGSQVTITVPQRGAKKDILQTVERNAAEAFTQHRLKRASDLTARSQALSELQESLALEDAPLRIECVDVSHVQGTNVVASLVVFEDGLPKKSDYRRFSIRGAMKDGESIDVHEARAGEGVDDTAAIAEVVTRRFKRHLEPEPEPATTDAETGRPRKFAYPPNLFIVDGGAPQVAAASDALADLGITDIAVIGVAKRLEEIWVPGESDPLILPRSSEAMYLIQRVRDEAHRFAITFHRQKRGKAMLTSALDGVPGLGEAKRKALLARFGSVRTLKKASEDELTAVPGIGPATARAIIAALHSDDPEPVAIDPLTGEVLQTQ